MQLGAQLVGNLPADRIRAAAADRPGTSIRSRSGRPVGDVEARLLIQDWAHRLSAAYDDRSMTNRATCRKEFRPLLEQIKMGNRLVDQQTGLGARRLDPEDRDEGGLTGRRVSPDRLRRSPPTSLRHRADRRRSGRPGPDRARSRAAPRAARSPPCARIAPASQENAISAPVFIRCNRVMAPMSSGCRSAIRSIIWPPTMPAPPAALGQRDDQLACAPRRRHGVSGSSQHLEGHRQQAVAGQDRGRLVESLVAGRLAAAQIAVVHRRQIVVD